MLGRRPDPDPGAAPEPSRGWGGCDRCDGMPRPSVPRGLRQAASSAVDATRPGGPRWAASRRAAATAPKTASRLIATCSPMNRLPSPAPRTTPATSGPTAEKPVCSAVNMPERRADQAGRSQAGGQRVEHRGVHRLADGEDPEGRHEQRRRQLGGQRRGGRSTSQDRVQMAPTPMSRVAPLRLAVSRTTSICRAMMTTQLTAAASPIVRLVHVAAPSGRRRAARLELGVEAQRQGHRDERGPAQCRDRPDARSASRGLAVPTPPGR